jgi:molybdopterin converting factor small subunit
VRKGCRHPDGWDCTCETESKAGFGGKAASFTQENWQARQTKVMQVSFNIPGPLREFTMNQSSVRVDVEEGATLFKALQSLFAACPGLRDRVLTEAGAIRHHVNIFVGNEDVRYTGGLATIISAGAEISIVPAISGG